MLLTSSLTQWPPELTHKVLTYLDSDDVARMARIGNSFQAEAERLLSRRRANWKSLGKPDMYKCIVDADPTIIDSGQGCKVGGSSTAGFAFEIRSSDSKP